MVKRTVICDRCGKIIENPHPDRISIYKHRVEEYKDYFGKSHKKSVYKAEKPMHLCIECEIKFNEFCEKCGNDLSKEGSARFSMHLDGTNFYVNQFTCMKCGAILSQRYERSKEDSEWWRET